LIARFGNEFRILLDLPEEVLRHGTPPGILLGILNVRAGNLVIEPGYDGVYGKVAIPCEDTKDDEQLGLF
jgi:PHP family Zn ribbon phosphoesterase